MTKIYLGYPTEKQVEYIRTHYGPKKSGPLCFTANKANSTVSLNCEGEWPENFNYLKYSTDGKTTWLDYTGQTIRLTNINDKVYFNTPENITNNAWGNEYEFMFSTEGSIAASGNLMSLVKKDGDIEEIPNEEYYFYQLFYDCTSLTQAPELPATTLVSNCYTNMFYNCTSLTTAPELPATTLAKNCYYGMFDGCSNLTTITNKLPATTLYDHCYYQMFNNCTSLTQAPELPATTLESFCYSGMFSGCTNLKSIKVHFTDWGSLDSTNNWLDDHTNATFYCPTSLDTTTRDISHVPSNWTISKF